MIMYLHALRSGPAFNKFTLEPVVTKYLPKPITCVPSKVPGNIALKVLSNGSLYLQRSAPLRYSHHILPDLHDLVHEIIEGLVWGDFFHFGDADNVIHSAFIFFLALLVEGHNVVDVVGGCIQLW
ncbi:hypothetical protein Mapa_005977 [Marchantia paleacea]|nr:hypothetical protein Mapa_005977 [Marchantia paleacea]